MIITSSHGWFRVWSSSFCLYRGFEKNSHDSFESNIVASVNNAFFLPLLLVSTRLNCMKISWSMSESTEKNNDDVKETTGNSTFGHCELLVSGENYVSLPQIFKAFEQKSSQSQSVSNLKYLMRSGTEQGNNVGTIFILQCIGFLVLLDFCCFIFVLSVMFCLWNK